MRERPVVAQRNAEPTGDIHQDCSNDERAGVKHSRQKCRQCADVNRTQADEVDPFADAGAHRLAVAGTRGEAVTAVHRLVAARLERDFRNAAALAAGRFEHLSAAAAAETAATAAAAGSLAGRAAIAAAARLVGESFACKEFLLACCERERTSAINAI